MTKIFFYLHRLIERHESSEIQVLPHTKFLYFIQMHEEFYTQLHILVL